jgi:hypothetical protein
MAFEELSYGLWIGGCSDCGMGFNGMHCGTCYVADGLSLFSALGCSRNPVYYDGFLSD